MNSQPIHGELRSENVLLANEVKLYKSGSKTLVTVGAAEKVAIDSVVISASGAGDVHLFFDDETEGSSSSSSGLNAIDAGETIVRMNMASNSQVVVNFLTPRVGFAGGVPKIRGVTGVTVNVVFTGEIRQVI